MRPFRFTSLVYNPNFVSSSKPASASLIPLSCPSLALVLSVPIQVVQLLTPSNTSTKGASAKSDDIITPPCLPLSSSTLPILTKSSPFSTVPVAPGWSERSDLTVIVAPVTVCTLRTNRFTIFPPLSRTLWHRIISSTKKGHTLCPEGSSKVMLSDPADPLVESTLAADETMTVPFVARNCWISNSNTCIVPRTVKLSHSKLYSLSS